MTTHIKNNINLHNFLIPLFSDVHNLNNIPIFCCVSSHFGFNALFAFRFQTTIHFWWLLFICQSDWFFPVWHLHCVFYSFSFRYTSSLMHSAHGDCLSTILYAPRYSQNYWICFATVFPLIINWQCIRNCNKQHFRSNPQRDFNRNSFCDTIASLLNGIRTFTQSDFVPQLCQLELHCKSQLSGWLA